MKKIVAIITGAYFICCLFSAPVEANETPTFAEKGSKSKSKSKAEMSGCCCPTQGPCGPCGETGPKGGFPPIYATFVQLEQVPADSSEWITDTLITLPLEKKQIAKGIMLNATTNTFTLSKGVYSIHFQFNIETASNGSFAAMNFTEMYLDLNGGTTSIPLDWGLATTTEQYFAEGKAGKFSGSRIFTVAADSVVKFMLKRESTDGIHISAYDDDYYPHSMAAAPVTITLQKVNDL